MSIFSVGCMGHGHGGGYGKHHNGEYGYGSSTSNSGASGEIVSALEYMYDEERLAKDIYLALYSKYKIRQLYKIATNSETRHIDAVARLARRYGVSTVEQRVGEYRVSKIQTLYDKLYSKGIRSERDALEVGCMVEVTDIDDLNGYMEIAERAGARDALQTFDSLRRGSYNHYWAFDRALKRMGISNGCCSLEREYCHPEYPQQNGRGGGKGRGGW